MCLLQLQKIPTTQYMLCHSKTEYSKNIGKQNNYTLRNNLTYRKLCQYNFNKKKGSCYCGSHLDK